MDSDSDDTCDYVCPICNRSFETMAGIRQHWSKSHSDSEIQAAIDSISQQSGSHTSNVSSTSHLNQPSTNAIPSNRDQSEHQSLVETLRNRATCSLCGFLAKNERGLNIHMRVHDSRTISGTQNVRQPHPDLDSLDEAGIIQKFGELMYKCKCSIPLVRIIQKSV